MSLDRRLHAVRDDLADAALADVVDAPRFVSATPGRILVPVVACRRAPADDAALDTELLFGEPLRVFDVANGWCWVQSAVDGYVGYVRAESVGAPESTSHLVSVPLALAFPEPSIKASPVQRLPMGARLSVAATREDRGETFHEVPGVGYVLHQHARPLGRPADDDWVAVAEMFVGTPYLFGGKSWYGIDCSGLVQLAIQITGREAPRDSDMQAARLGEPLPPGQTRFARGDLVFWDGHVGVMLDATRCLHANAFHMTTAIEPVAGTLTRLAAKGLNPTAMRRFAPRQADAA